MTRKVQGLVLVVAILLFSLASPVFALKLSIGKSIGLAGKMLYDILSNAYAVYVIVMVIITIMLHRIMLPFVHRIEILSSHSSPIAWCLALLSVIGFTYLNRGMDINSFLRRAVFNNLFVAAFLMVMMFFLIRASLGRASA